MGGVMPVPAVCGGAIETLVTSIVKKYSKEDGTPEEVFQDDAFLASIHLDIPFAHKLNKKLKELGLDYGKVKNDYELREKICQSH